MKRLIFRLSSLGDLVLSQSVLEPPYSGETHWVVAKEFESLVLGNPKLARVWSFDRRRSGGLFAWLHFLEELRRENFTEVLDAHSTLRTQVARIYFRFFSRGTRWRKISKERFRRLGYEALKRFWPRRFRPTHFARKCALLAGGYGNERPNLRWLLAGRAPVPASVRRIAVAPSSAWPGKEWPAGHYLTWLKRYRTEFPVDEIILLGTVSDRNAVELRESLRKEGVPFTDRVGQTALTEVARTLATCTFVVGADSGLLHLAEAVGVPVVTLFGPTRADFGFGPLDERSRPVQSALWCSPCSKDGTLCFRPFERFACLQRLEVRTLEGAVKTLAAETRRDGV